MKFIVGVATGIVLGIAGAIAYSFKSGRDLSEVFETTKSDIENADFDEMGKQLEARISEMQSTLEERINEVKANAQPVLDGAGEQIDAALIAAEGQALAVHLHSRIEAGGHRPPASCCPVRLFEAPPGTAPAGRPHRST